MKASTVSRVVFELFQNAYVTDAKRGKRVRASLDCFDFTSDRLDDKVAQVV